MVLLLYRQRGKSLKNGLALFSSLFAAFPFLSHCLLPPLLLLFLTAVYKETTDCNTRRLFKVEPLLEAIRREPSCSVVGSLNKKENDKD